MPKGVEHSKLPAMVLSIGNVKIPMMPKGVEHPTWEEASRQEREVKIPMMPKGVGHVTAGPPVMSPYARAPSICSSASAASAASCHCSGVCGLLVKDQDGVACGEGPHA